ncbi:MAG: NADH-quinone oxidoreductase subunit NuoK [Bdellovibrionales bacterium]
MEVYFPLFLSALLFFIGMAGVLIRRNILVILMSLELMLNAVNLNLLSFAYLYNLKEGPVLVFFIMSIAAAEAGIGLALAVRVYRVFKGIDVDSLRQLRG